MPATVTKSKRKPVNPRNPAIRAIFDRLDRKSWVKRSDLFESVKGFYTSEQAMKTYEKRVKKKGAELAGRNTKIKRGKELQLMLDCITLVQHGKLEQRGRGEDKEYRRLV